MELLFLLMVCGALFAFLLIPIVLIDVLNGKIQVKAVKFFDTIRYLVIVYGFGIFLPWIVLGIVGEEMVIQLYLELWSVLILSLPFIASSILTAKNLHQLSWRDAAIYGGVFSLSLLFFWICGALLMATLFGFMFADF